MEEIDLKEMLSIFWKKKFHIILITIFFIVCGFVYSFKVVKPDYKSSTTLILGRINSSEKVISQDQMQEVSNQITQSEISINSNLVSTYSELIKSKTLIKKVKDNLKIDISEEALKKSITVSRKSETELIEITATNADPKLASDIANEIAKVFSEKIQEIYNISNVYIIDPAFPDEVPYNINHVKDIIIFVLIGMIVSCGYVLLISIFDTTIKSASDVENDIGLKTLIAIPNRKDGQKQTSELITFEDGKSVISEAFKTLRTNVQFSNINNKQNKVMLVTSCFSSEGKSYISANLAVTFAQIGKKVILIDTDMRRGRQSEIFNIPNNLGLSNYLSNLDTNGMEINERVNAFIKETEIKNLNIITSGNVPPNPSELLSSNKLYDLIKELSIFYDLIIFDGPPVLPIADSLILARIANSTLLVSLANKTKKDELMKTKKDIQNVGGRIIGVVLNKVSFNDHKYENKYYYSYVKKEEKKNIKNRKINLKLYFLKFRKDIKEKMSSFKKNKIRLLLDESKSERNMEEDLRKLAKRKQNELSKGVNQEKFEFTNISNDDSKSQKQKKRKFEEEKKKREFEERKKIENQKKEEKRSAQNREKKQSFEAIEKENKKEENTKTNFEEISQKEILEKQELEAKQKEEVRAQKEKRKMERKENFNLKKEEFNKAKDEKLKEFNKLKNEMLEKTSNKLKNTSDSLKKISNESKVKIKDFLTEKKKIAEEKRKINEENKKIEMAKKEEERKKQEEIKKKEEEKRLEEEKIIVEERAKEEKILAEIKAKEAAEKEKRELEDAKIKEAMMIAKREEAAKIAEERAKEREELAKQRYEEKLRREEQRKTQRAKKLQEKEERKAFRQQEKLKQKEEARIQEELLEDNLYPKTKFNKDL